MATFVSTMISLNTSTGGGGGIFNRDGVMSVTAGTLDRNVALGDVGGGIENDGTIMVADTTLSNNTTVSNGGGIFASGARAASITSSSLSGNKAADGGGIFNYGTMTANTSTLRREHGSGLLWRRDRQLRRAIGHGWHPQRQHRRLGGAIFNGGSGSATVSDSTMDHDSAGDGGGLYNTDSATAILTDSLLCNDTATAFAGGCLNLATLAVARTTFLDSTGIDSGGAIFDGGPARTTITASTLSGNTSGGGGIFDTDTSTTTITACTLSGNSAAGAGGVFDRGSSTTTISDCLIIDNSATTYDGGGVYVADNSMTTLTGSTVIGNTAPGNGGGVFVAGGFLTIEHSTISGNAAGYGGGILNIGTLTVTDSTICNNTATSRGGGIDNYATLTVSYTTLSGNSAAAVGGGIENVSIGSLTLSASTLSGNTANSGAGIFNGGTATLTDTTLGDNSTLTNGGGIDNAGTLTVYDSTLASNAANSSGGGIFNGVPGTVTLENTIVAGSIAGGDLSGNFSGSGDLIQDGGGGATHRNDRRRSDARRPGRQRADRQETFALLAGNPAIDAGDDALVPVGLVTDQRGQAAYGSTATPSTSRFEILKTPGQGGRSVVAGRSGQDLATGRPASLTASPPAGHGAANRPARSTPVCPPPWIPRRKRKGCEEAPLGRRRRGYGFLSSMTTKTRPGPSRSCSSRGAMKYGLPSTASNRKSSCASVRETEGTSVKAPLPGDNSHGGIGNMAGVPEPRPYQPGRSSAVPDTHWVFDYGQSGLADHVNTSNVRR